MTNKRWATSGGMPRDLEIEHFVCIDLTGSSAMGAPHVIGQNFEPGHRVGFGVVAQQKIAHLLIGIGEMRVRLDPDEPAENASGAIVERVFVKEIAGGMRRNVVLQRAGVEFLFVRRDGDGEQIAARAFADETAKAFKTGISCCRDADSNF